MGKVYELREAFSGGRGFCSMRTGLGVGGSTFGSFRKLGVPCWGPYNRDPTIEGTFC